MGLLTKDDYKAIAKDLMLPCSAFVDGGYRAAMSGKTFPTVNPAACRPFLAPGISSCP